MKYIFMHGLGQAPSSWDKVINSMGIETAACPCLSKLGISGGISYDSLYGGFKDYCNSFNTDLCLCGLSLGAVLALNYTLEHPEKVKSLVLIAPQYKAPRLLLSLQSLAFRAMPERLFQETGFNKAETISLTGSMRHLDLSNALGNIACPTQIICGEKDRANQNAARELSGKIPGAKLFLIEGAGHEVNVEAPEALSSILKHSRL